MLFEILCMQISNPIRFEYLLINDFFFILGIGHENDCLDVNMWFKTGQRGCRVLMVDDFSYNRNRQTDDKTYWICSRKVCQIAFFQL